MKKTLFLMFFFSIFAGKLFAQVTGVEKAEAMFIYNFSRLIEWPAEYRNGSFVIGVLGQSDIYAELVSFTQGKKVGFQDIEVKKFKTADEIVKCHVLFVAFAKTTSISEVANKLSNFSTLILAEKEGALDHGAAINFLIINNKLQFELKTDNVTKYNLKISQRLKDMAVAVK